jgi:hypothetical protein
MRFIPKGYMGSEAAIVRIAKTRDPSRWATNRISPDEQALWNGLGKTSNAEFVFDDLRVLVGNAGGADWLERGCDFLGALEELRKALYAGEITAHFVDENGKLNFILKDGWCGGQGADILLRGVVDLEAGWRQPVLLKTSDVDGLARSLPPAYVEREDAGAKDRALRRPTAEKRRIFGEWRESLNGRIPTEKEDIAAMKDRGVNRADVRELRKDYPRRPWGKPRASK